MRCLEAREQLAAFPGDSHGSLALRRHLSGCPECRGEQARFVAVRTGLGGLQAHVHEPPPDLLGSLVDIPASLSRRDSVRRHVSQNRKVYVGGVLVAAGAGALAWRARRLRLAA